MLDCPICASGNIEHKEGNMDEDNKTIAKGLLIELKEHLDTIQMLDADDPGTINQINNAETSLRNSIAWLEIAIGGE